MSQKETEVIHRRESTLFPTRIMFYAVVLLLMLWTTECFAIPKHRCVYDDIMRTWGKNVSVARVVSTASNAQKGTVAADVAFAPIRIKVFAEDLNDESRHCTSVGQSRPQFLGTNVATCSSADILTTAKKDAVLNYVIPYAIQLHADRLLVVPLQGTAILTRKQVSQTACSAFSIPPEHFTIGVTGGDMFMYAASGPTEANVKGWATECHTISIRGRPLFGAMNINPRYITKERWLIRSVAHELAHALGFNYPAFERAGMTRHDLPIRRKSDVLHVASPRALEKARAHYNCDRIAGMELENEGGRGTAHSHWERRNARDELMAGIAGAGYYSALTMAAFEDMGFYRANWGKEERMEWGRNAGCPFLEEKCVENGLTKYPDMFCTNPSSTRVCTFDRRGLGKCSIAKYTSPLPAEYQYFSDPTLGGSNPLFDYCPTVLQFSNTGCVDGKISVMPGSRVGPKSLCLKGEGLQVKYYRANAVQDVCADVSCEQNTVRVRYAGDDAWHPCPEGSRIKPKGSFAAGKIVCPRRAEVCGSNLHDWERSTDNTSDNKSGTQTKTCTTFKNEGEGDGGERCLARPWASSCAESRR